MPDLPPWSQTSANCRLEWRPSAWPPLLLRLLGAAGAFSLVVSGLPRMVIWPGALLALGYGLVASRRQADQPWIELELDDETVQIDDEPVERFRVFWRGPLVFARWRDCEGRTQRIVWWPDTLDPTARRELRLALPREPTARGRHSVAP